MGIEPGMGSRPRLASLPLSLLALVLASAAGAQHLEARPNPLTHGIEPFRKVVRCFADWDGALWFGTYGNGLYRLGADGGVARFTRAAGGLHEDRVNGLAVHQGKLWIGTCDGIQIRGPGGFEAVVKAGPGSVANDIYHVFRVFPPDELWVGTTGKGVSVHAGGTWRTYAQAEGILEPWINDLARGPDGTVWVGTGHGLFAGRAGAFGLPPMKGKGPTGLAEVTALAWVGEALWAGTSQYGLYGFQDGYWFPVGEGPLPSMQVLALATTPDGTLWVGTSKGLAHYRFETGFRTVGAEAGLGPEEVKALHVDPAGTLWVGTFGGRVLRRDPVNGRFTAVFAPDG